MPVYEKILVAVDGSRHSDRAFDMACNLAQDNGSKLLILHVVQGSSGRVTIVSPSMGDKLAEAGKVVLSRYEAKLERKGIKGAKLMLVSGDTAQKIIDTARIKKCSLIVLGSRGMGSFKKLLLGSVSQKVTSHATCPVLVAR